MNRWKFSFLVTLALLVSSNLFWLYSAINAGVTYTYQQKNLEDLHKAHRFMGELMLKSAQAHSQRDILHLIRSADPDAFIVEEGNRVIVNNITFSFKDGRLSQLY